MSVNKVMLIGNLGADPELRHTAGGKAVAEFSVATQFKDKTEWHRIIAWEKLGENCAEYLSKGRQVYVEGRIQTRKWQDKEGNNRYTTEVIANTVDFLGSSKDQGETPPPPTDGDVPF